MHELSIAQNIIDIVAQAVPPDDRPEVRTVHLKLGTMAGVVRESLEFCFSALIAGSPFARTTLAVEVMPFTVECRACRAVTTNDAGLLLCPRCGSTDTRVVSGRELQVTHIDLEDGGKESR